MFSRHLMMLFFGMAAGIVAAAGVFALLTGLGVMTRLIGKSHIAKFIMPMENAVVLGTFLGNFFYIWMKASGNGLAYQNGVSTFIMSIYGLGSGIFVGALATSLAEFLNVSAIYTRRIKLVCGLSFMPLALAFGKLFGSTVQFFLRISD